MDITQGISLLVTLIAVVVTAGSFSTKSGSDLCLVCYLMMPLLALAFVGLTVK